MSHTSEEGSLSSFQQQPKLEVGAAGTSRCDAPMHAVKKRRGHPGNPDPDVEVVALSPKTLVATNRYICEVCHKGFQRDQNLQLHRRGHNLPWKLKQRSSTDCKKKVYICPEVTCPHHDATRALGDLTGIKKHFSRKHGEKKWKCDRCSKKYAVQSDWKAHTKICGTKEYRCDCGTIFSRKDSFITHRAFCDVLAEDNSRVNHSLASMVGSLHGQEDIFSHGVPSLSSSPADMVANMSSNDHNSDIHLRSLSPYALITRNTALFSNQMPPKDPGFPLDGSASGYPYMPMNSPYMSATALLQKAAEMGAKTSQDPISPLLLKGFANNFAAASARDHMDVSSGRQGDSMGNSVANGVCMKTAEDEGMHGRNNILINSAWTNNGMMTPTTVTLTGLMHHPFSMVQEKESPQIIPDGQTQHSRQENISGVGDVGLTQDFLGLGGNGNLDISSGTYNTDVTTLSYSDEQQKNQEHIYSYHESSIDSIALDKPMWDS